MEILYSIWLQKEEFYDDIFNEGIGWLEIFYIKRLGFRIRFLC